MIEVMKPGLFTTIQDRGRFGYRKYGVPLSGAMDSESFHLANLLLDNPSHCSVIEVTLTGPVLRFKLRTVIALTGANLSPMINKKPIAMNVPLEVIKGDELSFGSPIYGYRAYVSVFGGFAGEKVFGSRSFYHGICGQERLQAGDLLPLLQRKVPSADKTYSHVRIDKRNFTESFLEALPGPEFWRLDNHLKKLLFDRPLTLSSHNSRMAYIAEEAIANELKPIHSSPVLPGTVQLTPSGKVIFLMRDAQTTGGYPRILQLTEHSINRLSQKKPGDSIYLRLTEF